MSIDESKQENEHHYGPMPKCENSWEGRRLRQLGIDPDADPIEILMQLSDHYQNLHSNL
jgi:hypothetical protein